MSGILRQAQDERSSFEIKSQPPPGMEGVKGFDAAQLGLKPLRVEAWEGLVFVDFDPQAKPLLPSLGDLPEYVKDYGLGETVCTRRTVYDYPCNWKLLVENAMEGYHPPSSSGNLGNPGRENGSFRR